MECFVFLGLAMFCNQPVYEVEPVRHRQHIERSYPERLYYDQNRYHPMKPIIYTDPTAYPWDDSGCKGTVPFPACSGGGGNG